MPMTDTRKGEMLIFIEAVMWSLWPVLTLLMYGGLLPMFTAGASALTAAVFFAAILTQKRLWKQIRVRKAWPDMLAAAVLIGVMFYGLLYTGLQFTTAGNAGIIGQMEVLFAFVILGVLLKHEKMIPSQVVGAACMVLGALIVLVPKASGWHPGDLIILIACLFPPIGNACMQRARKSVSTEMILFARSAISGVFLLALSLLLEPMPSGDALVQASALLIINGVMMFGVSKILWLEGIRRIPVTKAISLASISPVFTLLFAALLLGEKITPYQVLGVIPMLAGVKLITRR
jgi:drug/metabolite transporter (DMT)-like permease